MHPIDTAAPAVQFANYKFPEIESAVTDGSDLYENPKDGAPHNFAARTFNPTSNGSIKDSRWMPHKKDRMPYTNGAATQGSTRGRQKSLSEAIRTIKTRRGSVTESAVELAEALKAPVSPRLVFLCGFWYMTSIFSNASSKAILISFRYPVTLTVVQFFFVCSWCIIASWLAFRFPTLQTAIPALKYKIRPPSRELIITTLPLTAFQIGGHILNSDAMARIPVSLVHTIKGLSPLFTVLAYRFVFRVHYSWPTYVSLVPLTLGVIMACQSSFSGNGLGLACAFGSAILFVTQNIASKKLFNEAARAEADGFTSTRIARKPDKLNLLCYSSGLALILTLPLWLWSEGFTLAHMVFRFGGIELSARPDRLESRRLALEFLFNGTFHFAQSLVAFVLLSMVSPVTYSVASLIKRVFVILFAIVWWGNPMSRVQAAGVALTFVGLYLYDRTNDAARADRKARVLRSAAEPTLLPMDNRDLKDQGSSRDRWAASPADMGHRLSPRPFPNGSASQQGAQHNADGYFTRADSDNLKRKNSMSNGAPPKAVGGWLPPGTKQETTWMPGDTARIPAH